MFVIERQGARKKLLSRDENNVAGFFMVIMMNWIYETKFACQ